MKWFEVSEKSAGEKRLLLTLFLYKIFGKKIVDLIAFLVGFLTYCFSNTIRNSAKNFYRVLYGYTKDKKYKLISLNALKNVLNYAQSLSDKVEIFSENFKQENILLSEAISEKGAIYIFNHIGNIEVLRALPSLENREVIIFMQKVQAGIFRKFCENIIKNEKFKILDTDNIDIATILTLDKKLNKNAIIFMAGDRISAKSPKNIKARLLDKNIELPLGVFKMAQKFDCETYFITAPKIKGKYLIKSKCIQNKDNIVFEWIEFMKECILEYPNQFYHFYDYFN